jgi:hypothetical protein
MKIDPQNRQQILTVAALLVVAFWFGDKFVVSPLIDVWKARKDEMVALQKSITRGKRTLQNEAYIRRSWDFMRTNALPEGLSTSEGHVMRAFGKWEQESQINVTSYKPQWKHAGDDYMTFDCRVDATGTMAAITRFLYEVEHDPLALKVDAVEIAARDNDGTSLTLGLQVSGLLLNPPSQ